MGNKVAHMAEMLRAEQSNRIQICRGIAIIALVANTYQYCKELSYS